MPRLEALNRYWKDFPPIHVLARRWMNYNGIEFGANSPKLSGQPAPGGTATARDGTPIPAAYAAEVDDDIRAIMALYPPH